MKALKGSDESFYMGVYARERNRVEYETALRAKEEEQRNAAELEQLEQELIADFRGLALPSGIVALILFAIALPLLLVGGGS